MKKKKLWFLLFLLLPLAAWIFLRICRNNPAVAEQYARHVFPVVTYIPRLLTNLVPFSITEVVVVLGGLFLLVWIVLAIRRLIKGPERKVYFLNRAIALLVAACILYPVFLLNFGYTYYRRPLAENLEMETSLYSKEELAATTAWVSEEVNRLAEVVPRDSEGLFQPDLSDSEILRMADEAYRVRSEESANTYLSEYFWLGDAGVKPVLLSHFWSYTGITGMYVPFFVESNVNIDVRPDEMMFTSLHEVAHSYGIAREDEANFLAFYCGILHEDQQMRYSAWLMGFTYLNNALYGADKEVHAEIYNRLSALAKVDLQARNAYWKQFEGPVKEVSTQINDSYLKANQQEDGVKSYGRVVDLILAYYLKEIR